MHVIQRIFAKGFPDNIGKPSTNYPKRFLALLWGLSPRTVAEVHQPSPQNTWFFGYRGSTSSHRSHLFLAEGGQMGHSGAEFRLFFKPKDQRGNNVRSHPHLQPSVEALLSFPLPPRLAPDTWFEGPGHHASTPSHVRHSVHCDSGKMGIKC